MSVLINVANMASLLCRYGFCHKEIELFTEASCEPIISY